MPAAVGAERGRKISDSESSPDSSVAPVAAFDGPDGRRGGGWAAPAIAGVLTGALLAVAATPILDHSPFEAGLFDTLLRFDLSLALAGLGLALSAASRRHLAVNLILIAGGIGMGALLGDQLAAAIENDTDIALYVLLVGPLQCVVTGIALAVPAALRRVALPPAALATGVSLGLPIIADSLSRAQIEFTTGALLAGIGLVLIPLLLLRPFAWPGIAFAGRIVGAWLVAIGLMLLTLEIIRAQG